MANVAQRAFSSGEVAPSLYARTDLQRYGQGLRTCRNFIPLRDGGITNRPGLAHVDNAGGSGLARVIPFVVSGDLAYCLELTNALIRVVLDGVVVTSIVAPWTSGHLFAIRYAQTANVLTLTHPSYRTRELTYTDASTWSLDLVDFGPGIDPPTGMAASPNGIGAAGGTVSWAVTALSTVGAESFLSNIDSYLTGFAGISTGHPTQSLSWAAVTGAVGYNVYKGYAADGWGFIGTTTALSFIDTGMSPDFAAQPPHELQDFDVAGDYPAAVGGYQQRRLLAGTTTNPDTFWASRTGDLANITASTPIQDDDAIQARLVSSKVTGIRHIVDADRLFLLADGGEWVILGDASGVLRPTDINALNFSKHGCAILPPIVIDRRILYVQARQSIVREIATNEVGPGYVGANLTILSSHLFKGYTLTDWAYAEEPHSVVWCVRSDGVLLSLTYLEEQNVLAWARHDTDGAFESVCVIPEAGEDRLYGIVRRNGTARLERMTSRYVGDVVDVVFMDAATTYDGRNTGAETMTFSGSVTWAFDEPLTVTRSVGTFTVGDIGNRIDVVPDDGLPLEITLTGYTSPAVMTGLPNRTVPADVRSLPLMEWTLALASISNLDHLEGKDVSIVGDGYVLASPNNSSISTTVTVTGGIATLPSPAGVVHVGLPYLVDAETLDIDTASGPSLKPTKMLVKSVMAYVEQSRAFWAGQSLPADDATDLLADMDEAEIRVVSDDYGPTGLTTDTLDTPIPSSWNSNGRIAIRHVDPTPLTILALIPRGELG